MSEKVKDLTEKNRVRLLELRINKDDIGGLLSSNVGLPCNITATLEAYRCLGEDISNFESLLQECVKYVLTDMLIFDLRLGAEIAADGGD